MDLGLRIYAELPDVAAGEALADAVMGLLPVAARVVVREVEPYWKIPAYQGVWLRVVTPEPEATFDALLAALAADWDVHDEGEQRWAVWNHDTNGPGALPSLRWMNLEPL
jgi:hypothetical protein